MKLRNSICNSKGFSLIEMAYVMLVLGILLLIAAPAMTGFLNSTRLSGTSNELMGDIHFTRSLAVMKRKTHHIEFTANEYKIVETATAQVIRTRPLPNGFTCAASGNPNFYAWGLADATNITISHGGKNRNLSLSANGNVSNY